jgi:eukaryotic-like serine/threonine-protein kinase
MASLVDRLQSALGPSYTIERELGRGGMATVFLAHDTKHGRKVALKVLNEDLAQTLGQERFRREIAIAARLQHPHILAVFDSGATSAGHLWFTMPYVQGESLADRLRQEGPLPIDVATRIAREVASALEYAHERGVVHRDVKPGNILLTPQGEALLADFGVARAIGDAAQLTQSGFAVGTLPYMSPEQAASDHVDARADVYALGAVCFEMLTGTVPHPGTSSHVRDRRPDTPVAIDTAIVRALAPNPNERCPSAAEFAAALAVAPAAKRRLARWLGWAIGTGALMAGVVVLVARRHTPGAEALAVLPFENLGDSADGYFADGVVDEIRGKLTGLSGLRVIARASSEQYRLTKESPQAIARQLGVRYILTGQVRWEKASGRSSRVRVHPELVEVASNGAPVSRWEQPFDADLSDVFVVQTDIADRVASALNLTLSPQQRRTLARQPTTNLEAYDAYLKGEAATHGLGVADAPSLRRGVQFYERAVALDSGFAMAWNALATTTVALYFNGTRAPADARESERAIAHARALAPDDPETLLSIGNYERYVRLDIEAALAAITPGLGRAPDNPSLLNAASAWESALGRWDSAVVHGQRAQALDPRSADIQRDLGLLLHYLRRYPEALAAYERALTLQPDNLLLIVYESMIALSRGDSAQARATLRSGYQRADTSAMLAFVGRAYDLYWVLDDAEQQRLLTLPAVDFDNDTASWAIVRAQTYWLRGDSARARGYADTARRYLEAQLRVSPDDWQGQAELGVALALLGRTSDAIRHGKRAVALLPVAKDAVVGPYPRQLLARIYMMAGEPDKALDQLEPLVRIPYYLSRDWLRIDPTWAPLAHQPRFVALVAGTATR